MKKYLKTKGVVVGSITGALVLIALLSLLTGGRTSFIQNGVSAVSRPVEIGIRNLVGTLERMYDHMHNYDTLEARYEALLDRVAAYERLAHEAQEVRDENLRLRELLDLPNSLQNVRYIDAHILSWDASNWTSAFTIDRGEDFGIAVGDPIVTERQELVGRVSEVGRSWATVQTILDPAIRVGGQMGSGVSAMAEGNFALMQDGLLRLRYIPSGEIPLLNDTITTSGLGGVIPNGLIIGNVERVSLEGTGVTYYALLRPSADIHRLVQVFVVQNLDADES